MSNDTQDDLLEADEEEPQTETDAHDDTEPEAEDVDADEALLTGHYQILGYENQFYWCLFNDKGTKVATCLKGYSSRKGVQIAIRKVQAIASTAGVLK